MISRYHDRLLAGWAQRLSTFGGREMSTSGADGCPASRLQHHYESIITPPLAVGSVDGSVRTLVSRRDQS
jgi:hypothetical protein